MKTLLSAIRILLFLSLLTGIVYPLLVTGLARLFFKEKGNGSFVYFEGKPIGSRLIGQNFDSSGIYFRSRPSAGGYNPLPSGGSNLGTTSKKLKEQFDQRLREYLTENRTVSPHEIPPEMLFASASGQDPHISPEAAFQQVDRVAQARKYLPTQKARLNEVIRSLTEPPQFLCLGQARINVLLLNLETDKIR